MSLQRNGLYEKILRRFIDGIMGFGDRRQGGRGVALCQHAGRIHRKYLCTHEDIGADRTERFMPLLRGRICVRRTFLGIVLSNGCGFNMADGLFAHKRRISYAVGTYYAVQHRHAKVAKKNSNDDNIFTH